ncbi:hypothetical protein [Planococcus sp. CAU13]|uniref:hypothetical protein n=1 Tax=Planococcus sp. CAU13 TaxID=1541197 RepID=UPI001F18D2FC|nr:hypothetical protein [Planococcus sp. CAU13]
MSILIVILLALTACTHVEPQSLEEIYKAAKIQNVNKIIIQDGSTGYIKTMTEQKRVEEFLALIKNIEYIPEENQEDREGWQYAISLFDGEEVLKFTLSEIDGIYYNTKPDISPIVDGYYKELDLLEE